MRQVRTQPMGMLLKFQKKLQSHEDIFVERYQRMAVWARQLADHDVELAEDLLHDAFVQFTLGQPDLDTIQNLDGYLYGILRNLRLSHLRRETRNRLTQLSVAEYDSAEDGLHTIDLRDQFQARDELQRICAYACARKETARAASVLILRFFHGYFPSEIAQVVRTSRAAVDVRLLTARNEVKAYLESPSGIKFIGAQDQAFDIEIDASLTMDEFLIELRRVIFQSRQSEHPSKKQLKEFYREQVVSPIEVKQLAHLVSCPGCLDEVNDMLNFPKLITRFANETLGREKRKKDDSGNNPPKSGGDGGNNDEIAHLRRHAQRVFEHKPKELSVSVNGNVQGSLGVNAELNELSLNVTIEEANNFIEIFSEQQVRFLLLNIEELPPHGASNHTASLALSDGRSLDLNLKFRAQGAELQLEYRDPTLEEVRAMLANRSLLDEAERPYIASGSGSKTAGRTTYQAPSRVQSWRNSLSNIASSGRDLLQTARWLRYGFVTAGLVVILLATFLMVRLPIDNTVSAAELLNRSAIAETNAEQNAIVHRTLKITSSFPSSSTGQNMIVIYSVETWRDAARGLTVRRVYDADGRLIAWQQIGANGTRSFRPPVARMQTLTPALQAGISNGIERIWDIDLTAKDFRDLIGNVENMRVKESQSEYIVSYSGSNSGLENATLTLRRDDLRPLTQTLTIRKGEMIYEHRYEATNFERLNSAAVSQTVFEPEPGMIEIPSTSTNAGGTNPPAKQESNSTR